MSGQNVILAVLLQRLVELLGVAAIIWALPRLARYCQVDPVATLWLGALNPVLLFHLIAGGHNEALMLGAMLAGLVIGLGAGARCGPRWSPVVGVLAITLGIAVKATAAMALPFLVIALALRAGPGWRPLMRRALGCGAVFVVGFGALTLVAGNGFGWVNGLGAPGTVRSFLSVTTSSGVAAGFLGQLLGVGDFSDAAISVMQPIGTGVGLIGSVVLMWWAWRGRLAPVTALGLALGGFVLLGPVIQPWYLLWAVLPLAAATVDRRFRLLAVWFSAAFALIIMPNGATIPPFAIIQAVAVAAVVVGIAFLLLRRAGLPRSSVSPRQGTLMSGSVGARSPISSSPSAPRPFSRSGSPARRAVDHEARSLRPPEHD